MGWMTMDLFLAGLEKGYFSLLHHVLTDSVAHSASYQVNIGALSLGVKWPGCETDHSCSCNAEIQNAWSYTSTLPYVFMM
jgi:hypothetical protein